jgi:hypothetical protein
MGEDKIRASGVRAPGNAFFTSGFASANAETLVRQIASRPELK